MRKKFKLEIMTPLGIFFEGDTEFISFVSLDGEMGVMAEHAPTLVANKPCTLIIKNGDKERYVYIAEGFIKITRNVVSVIVDFADWSTNIDTEEMVRKRKLAEEELESKEHDKARKVELMAAIERARAAEKTSMRD